MQMQCHCNVSPILAPVLPASRRCQKKWDRRPAGQFQSAVSAAGRLIFPVFRPPTRSGGGCRAAPIASLPQPLFLPRPANARSPWDRLSSDFVGSLGRHRPKT